MLVYTKAIDFCTVILYPGVLLNSPMSSNSLSVDSLGAYRLMLIFSTNHANFVSSFSTFMLISFSGVITLSRTILNIDSDRIS